MFNRSTLACSSLLRFAFCCFTTTMVFVASTHLDAWQRTSSGQKIDLAPRQASELGQHVNVRVNVQGNLLIEEEDQVAAVPLRVDADFDYQEKALRSSKSWRSVRRYDQATARIKQGKKKSVSELTPDNQWIVVDRRAQPSGAKRVRFLTSGSGLSQREYDLLALPANSMFFDRCIEKKDLSRGATWKPDADLLADLLFVDEIIDNEFEFK